MRLRNPGRWLLILTPLLLLAAALIGAWPRICADRLRREFLAHGGFVQTTEVGPAWLRDWVGGPTLDWFGEIVVLSSSDRPSYGRDELQRLWRQLQYAPNLLDLRLRRTPTRDEDLIHLRSVAQLRGLDLDGTEISDDGLRHIAVCTHLRRLELCNTHITGPGLRHLKTLIRLETLYLDGTSVGNDEVVALVKSLPALEELSVSNTRVTEEGLRRLSEYLPDLIVTDD